MVYRTEVKEGVIPVSFLDLPADFSFPTGARPDSFAVDVTGTAMAIYADWRDPARGTRWFMACEPTIGPVALPDLPDQVTDALPALDPAAFACEVVEIVHWERVSAGYWLRTLARLDPGLAGTPQVEAARRRLLSRGPFPPEPGSAPLPRPASAGPDPRRTGGP
jgi:hypothetical protein